MRFLRRFSMLLAVVVLLPLLLWCLAPPHLVLPPEDAVRNLETALPVFPCAEGFGVDTPAGRGGAIIAVTSLSDAGPGTLREALQTPGGRVVVFECAGQIHLASNIEISQPFVTVAGQTAPAPGITLRDAGLNIVTHDVLVQHIAVRVGDQSEGPPPDARDGISVYPGNEGAYRVVVDHCSVSWAVDEDMSHWGKGVHDVTFRNCLAGEGLSHSIHPKGEHSKGLLMGDFGQRIAVIGCLFADNVMRNPFVKGGVTALIANNVIYNPGDSAIHLGDAEHSGPSWVSAAGNVLLPGPDTPWYIALAWVQGDAHPDARLALYGNDSRGYRLWHAWRRSNAPANITNWMDAPVRVSPLTLRDSGDTVDWVTAQAGSRPAMRDPVDARIVEGMRTGSGRIIDHPEDVGGLPDILPVYQALSLPSEPEEDADHDGYTNLEEWLHERARIVEGRPEAAPKKQKP